jgi:hypothetical protein
MEREPAAGPRSHRRLIMLLLALTVGATLGAAAPRALAALGDAKQRYQPTFVVDASSTPGDNTVSVSVSVCPVEIVGEYVAISVQRKASGRRWTPVTSHREQVDFWAPTAWAGTFTTEITAPPHWSQVWTGLVTYKIEPPDSDPVKTFIDVSYADYSLTEAIGTYTWTDAGEEWRNDRMQHWWMTYPGTRVEDMGALRVYFWKTNLGAETVPMDSYEGSAFHRYTGVPEVNWEDGTVEKLWETPSGVGAWIWPDLVGSPLAPRPLLEPSGRMTGSYVRAASSPTGSTESSRWNLAPSDDEFADPLGRHGGSITFFEHLKKGLYRVRVSLASTADHPAHKSSWYNVRVR